MLSTIFYRVDLDEKTVEAMMAAGFSIEYHNDFNETRGEPALTGTGTLKIRHDGASAPANEREALEHAIERMGWPEIHAFDDELRRGQSIFEDAGGYMLRCIRRLFGLPQVDERVVTYQRAARALVEEVINPDKQPRRPK